MIDDKKISDRVIPRLSLYYRVLLESRKIDTISSEELGVLSGVTAAQVRKDLTYFGHFGIPGKGYRVTDLRTRILKILGTDRLWSVALIGVGNLGKALLSYDGFRKQGFNVACAFDNDSRKIAKTIKKIKVQAISELQTTIKKKDVRIAILTVPTNIAQDVVNILIKAGVRAILNFAPIRLKVPEDIQVLNIDLSIELERLAYFLKKNKKDFFCVNL